MATERTGADLVIGGSGLLARAIMRRLASEERDPCVLTRDTAAARKAAPRPAPRFVKGDLNETKKLPERLQGVRAVYFAVPIAALAAGPGEWDPGPFLGACADARVHLIVPIDISLYQPRGNPPHDEKCELTGRSEIGRAQLEWESAAFLEGLRRRFKVTVLRFPRFLGEGLNDPAMRDAVGRAAKGRPIEVVGRGDDVVEYLNVEDAARACVLAADRPAARGEIVHVPAHPIRRKNLLRVLVKVAGTKSEVVSVAAAEPARRRRRAPEPPRDCWVRGEKAQKVLGFTPRVSYEQSFRESLEL